MFSASFPFLEAVKQKGHLCWYLVTGETLICFGRFLSASSVCAKVQRKLRSSPYKNLEAITK
jgi:hypothetical protein